MDHYSLWLSLTYYGWHNFVEGGRRCHLFSDNTTGHQGGVSSAINVHRRLFSLSKISKVSGFSSDVENMLTATKDCF